jgi:hypothetical protein
MVELLIQDQGKLIKIIKMSGSGQNALDFFIAYYLGAILKDDPESEIHIISGDKGFNPLLTHVKQQGAEHIRRCGIACKQIMAKIQQASAGPTVQSSSLQSENEAMEKIYLCLKKCNAAEPKTLPRTLQRLESTIKSHIKTTKIQDVQKVLNVLKKKQIITILDGDSKVTYNMEKIDLRG